MADLGFWDIIRIIYEQFPELVPILQKPGVFQVLVDSINNNWSDDRRNAALAQTDYYKNNDAAHRYWDVFSSTDPASAKTRGEAGARLVTDTASALGVTLTPDQSWNLSVETTINGWDASRVRYEILAAADPTSAKGGDLASTANSIKSLASDYAVPLSDTAVMQWAKQMEEGAIDINTVKGYLIEQAKSLFPGLASALDRGVTVKQYADPYIQAAVQELGINPDSVDLTDPKWMSALNQIDPKTGARVSLSLDDWTRKLRTDPTYGYDTTNNARASATQLTSALEAKFGAAA